MGFLRRLTEEDYLQHLYERDPARFVALTVIGLLAAAVAGLVPVAVGIGSHVLGLSLEDFLAALGLIYIPTTIVGVSFAISFRRGLRALRRPLAETKADDSLATETLATASTLPADAAIALGTRAFLLVVPVASLVIPLLGDDLSVSAVTQILIGSLLSIAAVTAGAQLYLELACQPIRAALDRHQLGVEGRALQLTGRLVIGIAVTLFYAAAITGAVFIDPDSNGLFVLFAVAAAISLVLVGFGSLPLSLTILHPIRRLITGTKSVSAGDLETEVPVTSSDELGELTASFNQMVGDLRRRSEELRSSRARIVTASDEARRSVERDLHDGAQQNLVLLSLKLGMIEESLGADPSRAGELLAESRADLQTALAELRDLAHGIYPAALTSGGIAPAIKAAAGRGAIAATIESSGLGRYRPELEAAVYFCCLEALQNASKYAGDGAAATVRLEETEGWLRFEVADDGAGFDPSRGSAGAGLQNLADRIGALGGEVETESAPGQGTVVSGAIPVQASV